MLLVGCSDEDAKVRTPKNPKEAASNLDQAFASARPEIRESVATASEALRRGEYEKAVVNLRVLRTSQELTPDQGLAVYNSGVALEMQLIRRIEAGDPNARRAYDLLKAMKRD
ncbi:MAG: hypothetical protein HYY24_15100 [Verrucomicrobia bacterium]|nr:hypothetical protein [Verrucomicrobiota bacterium]